MTEDNWKTLRVPPEAYERAKAQKDEHGRTWGEQLVCDNPTTTEVVDVDALIDELGAQAGGPQVDDTDIAREVVRQFDYAELAKAVGDELEGRLR
jgi:hypothetical protein